MSDVLAIITSQEQSTLDAAKIPAALKASLSLYIEIDRRIAAGDLVSQAVGLACLPVWQKALTNQPEMIPKVLHRLRDNFTPDEDFELLGPYKKRDSDNKVIAETYALYDKTAMYLKHLARKATEGHWSCSWSNSDLIPGKHPKKSQGLENGFDDFHMTVTLTIAGRGPEKETIAVLFWLSDVINPGNDMWQTKTLDMARGAGQRKCIRIACPFFADADEDRGAFAESEVIDNSTGEVTRPKITIHEAAPSGVKTTIIETEADAPEEAALTLPVLTGIAADEALGEKLAILVADVLGACTNSQFKQLTEAIASTRAKIAGGKLKPRATVKEVEEYVTTLREKIGVPSAETVATS